MALLKLAGGVGETAQKVSAAESKRSHPLSWPPLEQASARRWPFSMATETRYNSKAEKVADVYLSLAKLYVAPGPATYCNSIGYRHFFPCISCQPSCGRTRNRALVLGAQILNLAVHLSRTRILKASIDSTPSTCKSHPAVLRFL